MMNTEQKYDSCAWNALLTAAVPSVMGILNVTPDSFHAASRTDADGAAARGAQMVAEGAAVLDIGACSTRPGSLPPSEDEELRRLLPAVEVVRAALPAVPLSIDTFRPRVAAECLRRFGSVLINDVSGTLWRQMPDSCPPFPYVLTCPDAHPSAFFEHELPLLRERGFDCVILDPGFGFGKTLDENYALLADLGALTRFGCPLLVGVSRKSMVTSVLQVTAGEALNGTTVLHTAALLGGATLLRVHDVREACQAVALVQQMKKNKLIDN